GRVMFVAPAMDQAQNTMNYCRALFEDNELLRSLVEHSTQDEIHLKRRIIFEVQAANAAHSRGKTAVAIALDESAFLKSGDAVNSGEDIVTALRPSLAITGGPLLLTSSPAGAEGLVYTLYKRTTDRWRCALHRGQGFDHGFESAHQARRYRSRLRRRSGQRGGRIRCRIPRAADGLHHPRAGRALH